VVKSEEDPPFRYIIARGRTSRVLVSGSDIVWVSRNRSYSGCGHRGAVLWQLLYYADNWQLTICHTVSKPIQVGLCLFMSLTILHHGLHGMARLSWVCPAHLIRRRGVNLYISIMDGLDLCRTNSYCMISVCPST